MKNTLTHTRNSLPEKIRLEMAALLQDRLADSIDAVAMTPEGLALAVLAEDEVLAALPLAPTHAGNDGCAAPGNTPAASGGPNRPFAGLASLLKHDASGDD